MTVSELKKLSRVERLQMLESVWVSLLDDEREMESPSWHESILQERTKKIADGSATFLTLDELKSQRKL